MKGKKMYKCNMEKGKLIFTDETGGKYTPTGKTYETAREIVAEYNLLMKILNDHAWSFPVIEGINTRINSLKDNLMGLVRSESDGRIIQQSQDKNASDEGGRSSPNAEGRRKTNAAEKVKG